MARYNTALAAQADAASLAYAQSGLSIHSAASAHRSALMDARNPLVLAAVTVTGRRVSDMPWSYNSDYARLTRQGEADRANRAAYTQRYVAEPAQWRANYATAMGQLAVAQGIDGYLYDAALIAIATPLVMAGGVFGLAAAGAGTGVGALALGGFSGGSPVWRVEVSPGSAQAELPEPKHIGNKRLSLAPALPAKLIDTGQQSAGGNRSV